MARKSARDIGSAIENALSEGHGTIELDFAGVEAVTPCLLDEILGVIQEIVDRTEVGLERIVVSHPTYEAVIEV